MSEFERIRPVPTPKRIAAWVRRVRYGRSEYGLSWLESIRDYGRLVRFK